MFTYIKKFWVALLGSFLLGALLVAFCWDIIPIRFVVSLAVFVFILNMIIEQATKESPTVNLIKKILTFAAGVLIFVGLRSIMGYLLDLPASQSYGDLKGIGMENVHRQNLTGKMAFEILFLAPGVAISYLVVQKGRTWRTITVVVSTVLLAWVAWTMKQGPHAHAVKRQAQSGISLDARRRNAHALINEAAATSSFGTAKETVSVFYSWNTATNNMVVNSAIANQVRAGERVLQLHPDEPPVVFEGQAFTQIILANTNGSFVGGTKAWVESWRFNWTDGRGSDTVGTKAKPGLRAVLTLNKGDRLAYKLGLNEATPWIEVPRGVTFNILEKNFRVYYSNGHPPIDVEEKDVILPDVSPTIIRVGSLVPDNDIEITGM